MDRKIIDYKIVVRGIADKSLSHTVQAHIASGWQPYGYPCLDGVSTEKQAMVKYEEEQPKEATALTCSACSRTSPYVVSRLGSRCEDFSCNGILGVVR